MKIFLGVILVVSALFLGGNVLIHRSVVKKETSLIPSPTLTESPTNTATPIPTTTPTATIKITVSPSPSPTQPVGNDLNSTMNSYRYAHGLSTLLLTNGNLCRIATTRVHQQVQAGSLDNHAGFQGEAASQKEFLHVGEILQYQSPPQDNRYLVYTGWADSAEHNAIMLDPSWTHGCGATSGPFAVFIFAR